MKIRGTIIAAVFAVTALWAGMAHAISGPTGLTAKPMTQSQIDLSWAAVAGASSYKVYRNDVNIGSSATATYSDSTGLSPATHYSYEVTAVDADSVESPRSSAVDMLSMGGSLASESSTTSNPNGAWSYGWAASAGGAFNLYDLPSPWWHSSAISSPWNVPSVGAGTNALGVHPGQPGIVTIARYTVPTSGQYQLDTAFYSGPATTGCGFGATIDVHVYVNNATIFDGFVNVNGYGPYTPFAVNRSFTAGDTVDFITGDGGNGINCDGTAIYGKLALTPSAHTITASSTGNGSISPSGSVTVNHNETKQFTLAADPGFTLTGISGTCPAGSGSATSYTTGAITADCTVIATFADTTGPSIVLSTLADGSTTSNPTLNLEGVVTDISGIDGITINGTAVAIGANGRFSYPVHLAPGSNTISVKAEDSLGNETTENLDITLDLAAPGLKLTTAPADNSTITAELVEITSTTADSSVTVDIRLNGASAIGGTGPTFSSGPLSLVTGFNTIEVIATDLAGRKNSLKRSIYHDSTKASLALTTPVQDQIIRTPYLAYKGTVADAVEPVTIKVSIDGGETFTTLSATSDGMTPGTYSGSTTFATPGVQMIFLKAVNSSDVTLSEVRRSVIYIPRDNSFNSDDTADLIWSDSSTGSSTVWFMNGVAKQTEADLPPSPGTDWAIVGRDDINNDGRTDLVWRNLATGQNLVWYMDGVNKAAEAPMPTIGTKWQYGGSGDFNGDGTADIVWRNPTTKACNVWYMDGASRTANGIGPIIAAEWSIGGVGDFDKDGIPDIVWRNPTTGATNLWYMNAGFSRRSNGIGPTISSAWVMSGVADFDRDGIPDVIYRNPTSGANNIWYMNADFTRRGNGIGTPLTGSSWSIVGR